MLKLVLPSIKYKKSFLKDFLEYQGDPKIDWTSWGKYYDSRDLLKKDFAGFVKLLRSQSKGQNLPKGYVPQTIFWLTQNNMFIGLLSLRHKLTPKLKNIGGHIGYEIAEKFQGRRYGNLILKLGLKKAKLLGIKKAILTCDATNIRSKKVIEANGGNFLGTYTQGKGLPKKLRFENLT